MNRKTEEFDLSQVGAAQISRLFVNTHVERPVPKWANVGIYIVDARIVICCTKKVSNKTRANKA